jgi:hypothetical protein
MSVSPLNFSIAYHTDAGAAYLRELLDSFAQEHQCQVQMQVITWDELWPALRKVALSKSGLDVSEVGSTWVGTFAGMAALRPFALQEVAALGGAQAFFPAVWASATLPGDPTVWAIPWVADTAPSITGVTCWKPPR